jgi:pimeloyl-ACP methyl ester carboxylesterase
LWLLVAVLVAGVGLGIVVGIDRAFYAGGAGQSWSQSWPPRACVVQGLPARCGTFVVAENRAEPDGPKIGLRVLVLPAWSSPAATDAVVFLAGGPGGAATQQGLVEGLQSSMLRASRDILLVDQRGTGGSRPPHNPDVTQYGTRMAMDDLNAVRVALGYRQLDLIGGSYGATAAQIYLNLHPSSLRTLILWGGTAIDIPFFGRYAVNAQHALDQLARLCASETDCRKAFPDWERQFDELVKAWNAHPAHGMTGNDLAGVVQSMLLDVQKAVSIPLVVSSAARGDYAPLKAQGSRGVDRELNLMGSSIWCNEPWAGLDTEGPWGTDFDGYATAVVTALRHACSSVPKRAEPRSLWTLSRTSRVPVLAFAGGADPQDPPSNLPNLKQHFRDSRLVVFPHYGHSWSGVAGCLDSVMTEFVQRGTTNGLDIALCKRATVVPPFPLAG